MLVAILNDTLSAASRSALCLVMNARVSAPKNMSPRPDRASSKRLWTPLMVGRSLGSGFQQSQMIFCNAACMPGTSSSLKRKVYCVSFLGGLAAVSQGGTRLMSCQRRVVKQYTSDGCMYGCFWKISGGRYSFRP